MSYLDAAATVGNPVIALLAGLLGLAVGSFLNVVIHRLPHMMLRESANFVASERGEALPHADRYNLLLPRSACPHCGAAVRARHNLPLLGWLWLRGRCHDCRVAIGLHYPAVELLTALLFAMVAWRFGATQHGLAVMLCCAFLVALAFIDARTMLLPDDLTLPLMWLGLLVNLNHTLTPLHDAVLGAAAGYLALWLIYWCFRLATGKEGMGYGDFKLMAALGAWLGWQALPFVLLSASALGAVVGIALVLLRRQERDQPIPFGPYLACAGVMALLFGANWLSFGLYDY
jgi:leader peptidase (prepilin peptidase)/N-methyltransferase